MHYVCREKQLNSVQLAPLITRVGNFKLVIILYNSIETEFIVYTKVHILVSVFLTTIIYKLFSMSRMSLLHANKQLHIVIFHFICFEKNIHFVS